MLRAEAAVFWTADDPNKATRCCRDTRGHLAESPVPGKSQLLPAMPLRTSPQGTKNMCQPLLKCLPLTINHTPWKMPYENTQTRPLAPTGNSL